MESSAKTFVPFAPVFGHDRHFYSEARKRTPTQLALGDEEYGRLKRMWRRHCSGAYGRDGVHARMCARVLSDPDRSIEPERSYDRV
jgi:hypothetical protein